MDYLVLAGTPNLAGALALRAVPAGAAFLLFLAARCRRLPRRTLEASCGAVLAAVLAVAAAVAGQAGGHLAPLDAGVGSLLACLAFLPWDPWKTAASGGAAWGAYAGLAAAWAGQGDPSSLAVRVLLAGLFAFAAAGGAWLRHVMLYRAFLERVDLEELSYDLSCLAERDDLTGLYNYRSFWSALREQLALAERSGRPVSLLLLDLDGFKQYNDTMGHLQGDALLRTFGGILASSLRSGDMAFRQGGDEFAVILLDTDGTAARNVARRLSEHLDASLAEHADRSPITVSIGVACSHTAGYEPQALVEAADRDLYRTKGRRAGGELDDRAGLRT